MKTNHLPSNVHFREDINGLRAWAVIAVLLFHFQLPGFDAGFIGVDVFFVISGFLMTVIIVKGLQHTNFSIWRFYAARARRILPALMVLIVVLLLLGWFWLPSSDYKALGFQSVFSLALLSNIYFWRSTGYFDSSAHDIWLLHTWSLSVEAQFYLLFPIFLIILWKMKPHIYTLMWGLGFLFIASLALSIVASQYSHAAAFYLLPTRGWELSAGGLAFLISREINSFQKYNRLMLFSGFGFLVLALMLLDSGYSWPSGWALLPVLGTVLIILSNQTQTKLTVNSFTQWFGERSYSLYLWHWPLVVIGNFAGLQGDWLYVSSALVLSLILAHWSYHLIEVPTRSWLLNISPRKEIYTIILLVLFIFLAALSVLVFRFEGRVPSSVTMISNAAQNWHPRRDECHTPASGNGSPGCTFGNRELNLVVIGDSHAVSTINPLEMASNEKAIRLYSFSSCPFIENIFTKERGNSCALSTEWVFNTLATSPELDDIPALIVNSYGYFLPNNLNDIGFNKLGNGSFNELKIGYAETICRLATKRKVYLLRPYPIMPDNVPKKLIRDLLFNRPLIDSFQSKKDYYKASFHMYQAQNSALEMCGGMVEIIDPIPYLCDAKKCYGSKDGFPLYYDTNHLTEYGNQVLEKLFNKILFR